MRSFRSRTAALFCLTAGLSGQTGRDAYRRAYDFWQQSQVNLERDAGTGGVPQITQAQRAAASAATFLSTRVAYMKSLAEEAAKREKVLQAPAIRLAPDLMPPAVASLAAGELLTVNKAIVKFAADKDPAIQQLRQSLERERDALIALENTIHTRQGTTAAASKADVALEEARAKTAGAFRDQASQLSRNVMLMEMESAAWAEYYSKLSSAIQIANSPAPEPAPAPIEPPTPVSTSLSTNVPATVSAPAPRSDSISPVPLVRYVGEWVFPVANGVFHGITPVSVELAVHESKGHVDGTLSGRFKPLAGVTEPTVQLSFEGEIAATPTQRFTVKTNDGRSGVIELIPGPAFNLLEVNFQTDPGAGKIRSGNFILVKK